MATHGELDSGTIARLRELGGDALLGKLARLFADFGSARVADVVSGGRDGDLATVARGAHALRSTAGNIGATRLLDLATQLEQVARAGHAERVPALVSDLRTAFVAARKALSVVALLEEAA